jgi:hypothetical protein
MGRSKAEDAAARQLAELRREAEEARRQATEAAARAAQAQEARAAAAAEHAELQRQLAAAAAAEAAARRSFQDQREREEAEKLALRREIEDLRAQLLRQQQQASRPPAAGSPMASPAAGAGTGRGGAAPPLSREWVLEAIATHQGGRGMSAAALLRRFEVVGAPFNGGRVALRRAVAELLQGLVDEFEVVREGAGARSSFVDVTCEATLYRQL